MTDWIDPALLQGEVISDGELAPMEMTMEVAQMLRDAGPWGQMFPEPLFDGRFRLLQQRIVGERRESDGRTGGRRPAVGWYCL